jgi:phage terminase large subunit
MKRPPKPVEMHLATTTRKKDEQRSIGLGPEHDWSSHAADAFGLMAVAYEGPSRKARFNRKIEYPQLGIV